MTEHCRRLAPRRRALVRLSRLLATGAALHLPASQAHDGPLSDHAAIAPASRDTLTVVGPWELTGLEPSRGGYMFTRMEVVQTLLDADDRGRLLPAVASEWEVSNDGLEWRFFIEQGKLFHDGSPLTAGTVLASLKRALAAPGVLRLARIRSMTVSRGAIVVTLAQPYAPLPFLFTHSGTQILAPSSYGADGRVLRIVGSGPYRITAISLPQQFDVAFFEQWRGEPPAVRRARYISVSRAETRTLMVQSGQADLAFTLDPPSIRRLLKHQNVQLVSAPLPRTTFLKLNAGHPLLNDVRVRQAISLALDRDGIARALLRDDDLGASQLFPPAMALWHQPALAPLRGDPAAARALLRQAGFVPGADGIVRRAGTRFEIILTTFVDRPELPLIATAVQEELRQVGIAVKVVVGNSSDIPAGHRSGALQIGLVARNFGSLPDPVATLAEDYGTQGGDWGAMGWHSAPLSDALARLSNGGVPADSPEAARLRAQVARELQQGLPVIPVVWYRQTMAVSRRLAGASIDPFERSYRISALTWKAA
ncbi:ABC transporter substrate-binding protein [Janthinobacterium sp. J1-1]|uniref:ABC transporter substrate-binding protein n=1 Tax=unclassified Janthinobacterium TaxID=2610881 RepID=UPI0035B4AB44